ncbi:hypothetical protein ABFS82_06G095600 [Erythranthe guttata]|uniref:stomatin-like protein 2, mitochondrial n=1 Tax=Erythranthe guttata TaxID=4155 RepID=UPI00064DB063|nr:PREDICTED: stomatin-like protein 2, mitochondrial [Erythranthe guttata]|eukprot:XP_012858473.1 PREDICTED: stomatin-like protein 2, mitochondrial [Erythranthe guttata]
MNLLRQNSVNRLQNLRNLLAAAPSSSIGAISTAPPPVLRQLPHPFFVTVRHITLSRDPSTRYDITPPVNWGIRVVPLHKAYVIERFGKYLKTLTQGTHFLIPFVDRIAYEHCVLEEIVDPKLASYGVKNPLYAAVELAQTTMQNEIGQITFMQAIGTRVALNKKIEIAINEAGERWGLKCMRYTTKDIAIPDELSAAMQKKAVSKLIRSAYAYEFKAMQAEIDLGNARKEAAKNISEAMQQYKDYLAEDLETIYAKARAIANKACATAKELDVVLPFLEETGDVNAGNLKIIEQYIDSFSDIPKEGTTPSSAPNEPVFMLQSPKDKQ